MSVISHSIAHYVDFGFDLDRAPIFLCSFNSFQAGSDCRIWNCDGIIRRKRRMLHEEPYTEKENEDILRFILVEAYIREVWDTG